MENKGIILCADDELNIRNLVQDILNFDFPDYNIELFEDGSSLERRLMTGLENVKLVLTDNRMPGITGIEIIRKYSGEKGFENIPFVLCSSKDKSLGEHLLNDGYIFTYLPKPFRLEDFKNVIRKSLKIDEKPRVLSR